MLCICTPTHFGRAQIILFGISLNFYIPTTKYTFSLTKQKKIFQNWFKSDHMDGIFRAKHCVTKWQQQTVDRAHALHVKSTNDDDDDDERKRNKFGVRVFCSVELTKWKTITMKMGNGRFPLNGNVSTNCCKPLKMYSQWLPTWHIHKNERADSQPKIRRRSRCYNLGVFCFFLFSVTTDKWTDRNIVWKREQSNTFEWNIEFNEMKYSFAIVKQRLLHNSSREHCTNYLYVASDIVMLRCDSVLVSQWSRFMSSLWFFSKAWSTTNGVLTRMQIN